MGLIKQSNNTKIANTTGGVAIHHNGKYHPCDSLMASVFLGNDDHPRAYCIAGCRIKKKLVGGQWKSDTEYHLFDEVIGRLSPDLIKEIRKFLKDNRIERIIMICSDEDFRNRMRKEFGCRAIFEDEKRRRNDSVILREWFARNKSGSEDSLLKIWGDCGEAVKSNYPPTRDCMVRLLDWYDQRMNKKISVPITLSQRTGYG